jgi:hypothetical protein
MNSTTFVVLKNDINTDDLNAYFGHPNIINWDIEVGEKFPNWEPQLMAAYGCGELKIQS